MYWIQRWPGYEGQQDERTRRVKIVQQKSKRPPWARMLGGRRRCYAVSYDRRLVSD